MKKRISICMVLFAMFCFGLAAEKLPKPVKNFHIKRLGKNKFFKLADYRKVKSFADFSKLAGEKYAKDIQAGLLQVDYANLTEPLMGYFKEKAVASESELPFDTTFKWMFYRKNGRVRTMVDAVWQGRNPRGLPLAVPAYVFDFCYQGKRYYFAVPKACLNLSLLKEEVLGPACNMKVEKSSDCLKAGDSVTVDLTASKDLTDLKITVTPEGAEVQPQGPNRWLVRFPKAGEYTISAEGVGCDGTVVPCIKEGVKVEALTECQVAVAPQCSVINKPITIQYSATGGKVTSVVVRDAAGAEVLKKDDPAEPVQFLSKTDGVYKVEVEAVGPCNQKKNAVSEFKLLQPLDSPFYLLGEIGFNLTKGCYSGYEYQRVGAGVWLVKKKLSFELLPGYAVSLTGGNFNNYFMLDGRLALHAGQLYTAAGIGIAGKVRDDEGGKYGEWKSAATLSLAAGVYLNAVKSLSLQGEFRFPVGSNMPVKYYHAFMLGVRYTHQLKSKADPCTAN